MSLSFLWKSPRFTWYLCSFHVVMGSLGEIIRLLEMRG
jgi:hypothetical protein